VTNSPQDGLDHAPSYYTTGYPKKLREEYVRKWHEEHDAQPGTSKMVEGLRYEAPPGYNETREHLWNFFSAVRTRRPVVEDTNFGNNTALGCHLANYSYFKKTIAVWDASGKKITG
jgi:hypothetical protein